MLDNMGEDYTKMGKDYCPACNYECNAATDTADVHQTPNPGDLSICLNCGEWLEFADDMALKFISDHAKNTMDDDNWTTLTNATKYIKERGPII